MVDYGTCTCIHNTWCTCTCVYALVHLVQYYMYVGVERYMYYSSVSSVRPGLHVSAASSSPFESALLKALSPFEKAYISRSLSRLFDSVNQLFGPGARGLPSEEDLHGTIKTMSRCVTALGSRGHGIAGSCDGRCTVYVLCAPVSPCSELSVSGGCGPLSTIVARNVEKTVKLFNMKCEQMVSQLIFTGTRCIAVLAIIALLCAV